jgi:hypothetical protein
MGHILQRGFNLKLLFFQNFRPLTHLVSFKDSLAVRCHGNMTTYERFKQNSTAVICTGTVVLFKYFDKNEVKDKLVVIVISYMD